MSWEEKLRPHLRHLQPYSPVQPPEARKGGIIKLDGNENPYGCSPRVRQALARYGRYHLYPDPEQREMRQALAGYVGLGEEHIVAGSGIDELIDLVLRLFLEPGDRVLNLVPTFGMYPFSTWVCGGETVGVEREGDFSINLSRVKAAIDSRTKVVFVASPNNPTGNAPSVEVIEALADTGLIVVVDEAYIEFGGTTAAPLVLRYPNVMVLRTFSKWAGLAGFRLGYGLFPPQLVGYIMNIKQPYNLSRPAQVAALESLKDLDYLWGRIKALVEERERLYHNLKELTDLQPYPSQGNFILCRVLKGEARQLHEALQRRGIYLRYFDAPRLRDCIRISVGRPQDSDALLEALKQEGM